VGGDGVDEFLGGVAGADLGVHGDALFVGGSLLNERGMEHHPLTQMTDANLVRVLSHHTEGTVGLVQFVTVDQVASLALYLCSDAASQITGANLSIDGGWTAQ